MDIRQRSLEKHYEWNGKIEVINRCPVETRDDLALAYTPGVAEACLEIQREPSKSYELTRRSNMVAVITDGTYRDVYIRGMAVLYPDLPAIRDILFKEYLPL